MWQTVKSKMKRFEKALLILAGSASLSAVLLNVDFHLLEASLYDLRMTHGFAPKPDRDIVLVTLDDETTKGLDEFAPLPLDLHTRFMEAMESLEPRALGYLVDFNQVSQVNPELFQKEWGPRFVAAATRMETKGTTVLLGTPFDVAAGEVLPPYPLSSLQHSLSIIHKDGNVFSEDKVTRRALLSLYDKPTFHNELAQRLGIRAPREKLRGEYRVPEVDGTYFLFRYHGNTSEFSYPRISFLDVIQGRLAPGALRGKIVLVGPYSKEDSSDFTYTPYSKTSFTNPKLVVHANVLDAVLHNEGIERAPLWINALTTFAATSIVVWWVLSSTPLTGVFATLGLGLAFLIFGQLLFQLKSVWIRESQPLIGIFVGYYLVVPYRLIREYRKRWDYQRKNEVLTQVEELKTNFLSLVTHDLKTPVARIQGLAEVLLRKSSERLIDRDKETLQHIITSTEELNRFISSVLELSKVESSSLVIRYESKDINQLIERLAELFKPAARAKKIKLVTNLDPLFPIRFDATLISKVLSNLIDNALKYSPQGCEMLIESREQDNWVVISVRDQGIGMTAEEMSNLFTRFHRVKNDQTMGISGTGLGLYLTKYFVEAHQGRVEVESEKGKGSTFKIFLPMHVEASATTIISPPAPRPGLRALLKKQRKAVPVPVSEGAMAPMSEEQK